MNLLFWNVTSPTAAWDFSSLRLSCSVWKRCTYAQSAVRCEAAKSHDVQSLLVLGVVHPTAHGSHGDVVEVCCTRGKKKKNTTTWLMLSLVQKQLCMKWSTEHFTYKNKFSRCNRYHPPALCAMTTCTVQIHQKKKKKISTCLRAVSSEPYLA